MCKKRNGFTFVEAVFALALLLVVASALLPLFTQIMLERENIALKAKAQQILDAALYEEHIQKETAIVKGRTTFTIRSDYEKDNIWKVCVRWNDYTGRRAERCGYVKR